ncbi:MAG: S-layer homology domain-containing protein [Clostridia bacterium]|nr:S-layer homology domain-containing protein [Clostridia bacterium]
MKKISKIFVVALLMWVLMASCVFAGDRFIETKTYTYRNDGTHEINKAYIEVFVGQKDTVRYEKDEYLKVSPTPDEMVKDEYGNLYAHYDVSSYKPGRSITIKIERAYEMSDYKEDIATRSESTSNRENELYLKAQKRVESDNAQIISKAKELTFGLSSDYKRAKAIFEYVNTNMKYNTGATYANKGALSALTSLNGVCEEYATLFAALCRSVDIPTKVIQGYRTEKVEKEAASSYIEPTTGETVIVPAKVEYKVIPHVWNEIYFDDYGWVPVDSCIVYSGKDGKKLAYFDSFCKIEGAEYVADGIYNIEKPEISYNSNFKEIETKKEIIPLANGSGDEIVAHRFLDVEGYKWAEDSINTLYNMNVIKGYSDTEFGPAGNITRIEFITMLSRVLKNLNYNPDTSGMIYYFLDYDKNHYSKREYDFLMRCLEDANPGDRFAVGYYAMSNIFGSSLQMNKAITREEVVALMDSFLQYKADYSYTFNDIAASKFQTSIIKGATNGLIKGYEDGSFRPQNPITRAEIAVILDRYIGEKDFVI